MRKGGLEKHGLEGLRDHNSPRVPRFLWFLANSTCVFALLLQAYCLYSPDWRIASPITYSYMHMGVRRQHLVGITRYGLQGISYDNGAILQTWHARVENVKSKGYTAIQYNEQVGKGTYRSLFSSFCPNACRDAILLRMEAYEQMKNANNLLAIMLVIACTLAVMGIAWYLFIDDRLMVIGGLWVSAAVTAAMGTVYWKHQTYHLWKTICSVQQIPFPFIGQNVTSTFLVAALLMGSTALLSLVHMFMSYRYKRQLQKSLESHLRNKQNDFDPYNNMTSPNIFKQAPPPNPVNMQPQAGLNTSQLFSGIGFPQNQNAAYQYPADAPASGPSMWNTNLKY